MWVPIILSFFSPISIFLNLSLFSYPSNIPMKNFIFLAYIVLLSPNYNLLCKIMKLKTLGFVFITQKFYCLCDVNY